MDQATHSAGARILLVDDNATNQEVASVLLIEHGYQVDTAENGQLALEALQQHRYDLVLMDCLMPVMDGFEATRRVRGSDPPTLLPDIPIIAVTACATPEDRQRCLDAGMNDFVTKPIMEAELLGAIGRMLSLPPSPLPATPEPGAESPDAIPVFDSEDMLHRLAGNRNIAVIMLRRLLSDMPQRLTALGAALHSGQTQIATREAHTIKGLAAGAGAIYLWQAARRMERLCKDDQLTEATQQLTELSAQIDLVLPEWQAFLQQS